MVLTTAVAAVVAAATRAAGSTNETVVLKQSYNSSNAPGRSLSASASGVSNALMLILLGSAMTEGTMSIPCCMWGVVLNGGGDGGGGGVEWWC